MGRWLVASAWPYINYVPHLGTMIGSVLSADVFARYLRMKGEEVLFVSGSDEHGTPIEVEAIKLGVQPKELTDKNHALVSELFRRWRISFDNYTRTESEIHKEFVRKFYMRLYERGYIFEREMTLPYCPRCQRFLPDRFVRGTCPYCGYPDARGDQCDRCGRLLEPMMLKDARCAICGARPEPRTTKHWFFDLPKLTEEIRRYIENNPHLPENAKNMSLRMIEEGLKPRSLTRDNKWGIPAPFPGAEGKTIYVWMEAVLGYISATIEYFVKKGDPEGWKKFWFDPETRSVYFIGKDNIPFHTIIFPGLLLASGEGYNLPWRVESTEYLMFEGEKFSKSRRIGVWIDEALEVLPADYWRFALIAMRPETKDANFTWEGFISIVNSLMNDIIGNFVHRTLSLIYRHFDAKLPEPGELAPEDRRVLDELRKLHASVSECFERFRFRDALMRIVDVARLGNRYLNEQAPWDLVKKDRRRAATVLHVAAWIAKALAIMLAPIIPDSADKLWRLLGYADSVHEHRWHEALEPPPAGQPIPRPEPLFRKISEEDLKPLMRRPASTPKVSIEDFSKLDLRVGRIVSAERIPGSNRLLKLKIDIGGEVKTSVSGIGDQYPPESLVGRTVIVLANIKPRTIRGVTSEVMILAATDDSGRISLLTVDREVKPGAKVS